MSWAQHEKDFVINYLKTTYWDRSAWTLFSDKKGRVWRATWSELDANFNENDKKFSEDCGYCRFRGFSRSENDGQWNVNQIDLKHENGTKTEIPDSDKPSQKDDSSNNYNSSDDRSNFKGDQNTERKPPRLSGGIEKPNFIPGYYRISYSNGTGSGDTGKFLLSDRGGSRWRQAFVLYKIHTDKNVFANEIYNKNPELVENIIYKIYYKNKGRYADSCKNNNQRFDDSCKDLCTNLYNKDDNISKNCNQGLINFSSNCSNKDQRFNDNCKFTCDEKWSDGTLRNNCTQGLINFSSNCRNGNQVKDDNCKFTCDPKWSDGTLRNNCEYGNAQWCNDNDNFKSSGNYSFCEKYIEDSQNQFNNQPYNRFKELTTNDPTQDFSKNYLKNSNINTKFINDIHKDCDFSVNRNNYDKCKKFINNSDFLGGKFVNWCKDNMDDNNCKDLLKDNASLRDRTNNLYLTTICSQSDKIIKDNRCKGFLEADNDNLNIKNDAEDILAKYCNTDNKIFNNNPLDDPSCYRIASKRCITATSNEDKDACNKYYVNIIKKLEEKSGPTDNVLYIYYDNALFNNLPVFYQLKKNISLLDNDNPKNFNSINQSIINDVWSAKIFACIQPKISGNFTFQLDANDGLRFWINGANLLNNYPNNTGKKESSKINLNKDIIYFFYFEFYEHYGGAGLSIKYKIDNETEYKDIPDDWYKPFKLFQKLTNTYEDSMLNYMINYPQNFLSDSNYKKLL